MSWAPHVTVAAVISNDAGQYLLVKESPEGSPVFNQPAGHLEAGETLIDAVIREVQEETCRPFHPAGLVGIYQWVAPNGHTYVRFCFHGKVGEPVAGCQLDADILSTHWLDEEQLRSADTELRSPMVLRCIQDHLAGRHIALESLSSLA